MDTPDTNPFLHAQYNGHWYGAASATDRMAALRRFTIAECETALQLPDLQGTVRRALEARVRRLLKSHLVEEAH